MLNILSVSVVHFNKAMCMGSDVMLLCDMASIMHGGKLSNWNCFKLRYGGRSIQQHDATSF